MNPHFKVGDTVKVLSRIRLDDGTYLSFTGKTLRSVFKNDANEFVGVVTLVDEFTAQAIFQTSTYPKGKYSTDLRVTDGTNSFATNTVVVTIGDRVS
jgi:hypothetical protein